MQAQRETRVTTQHLRSCLCQSTCGSRFSLFLLACRSVVVLFSVIYYARGAAVVFFCAWRTEELFEGKFCTSHLAVTTDTIPGVRPRHCGLACYCSRVFLRLHSVCVVTFFSVWSSFDTDPALWSSQQVSSLSKRLTARVIIVTVVLRTDSRVRCWRFCGLCFSPSLLCRSRRHIWWAGIETVLTQTPLFVFSTSNFNIIAWPPEDRNSPVVHDDIPAQYEPLR